MDARTLNAIANHRDVKYFVMPGDTRVDLSAFLEDPRNVVCGDQRGVAIFEYLGQGHYRGHYLFTPAVHGHELLEIGRKALKTLFTVHGARAIHGSTPRDNRAARIVNRALGFTLVGTSVDPAGRPCNDYKLDRETWASLAT